MVNGAEVYTGDVDYQVMPTDHGHRVCAFHRATPELVQEAIAGALRAQRDWEAMPLEDRQAVFLKAADLLATKYRAEVCAAVMVGTGKNMWQAEIDAAGETCDFWRFNAMYAQQVYAMQPHAHTPGSWNRVEYRPLEGFVAAITPFNFLAIGANLPSAPAVMGNVALWKPAETAMLGSYLILKILREAGLPDGVIQFLPGTGPVLGTAMLGSPDLAAIHFTGSTATFKRLWRDVAGRLDTYKTFPRLVGETGGKNFHFVHESAGSQLDHVVFNTYVPRPLAPEPHTKGPGRARLTPTHAHAEGATGGAPSGSAARSSTLAKSARRPRGCTCRTRCGRACARGCSRFCRRSRLASPTSRARW